MYADASCRAEHGRRSFARAWKSVSRFARSLSLFVSSSPAPSRPAPAQSRSYSSAPAPAKAAPAAAPSHATHPPAQSHGAPAPAAHAPQAGGGGGMLSGLAGTVMSGMAFGTGSAVAHRAVDAVMGPRGGSAEHNNAAPAAAAAPRGCVDQNNKFTTCMRENQGSIASCQYLFDGQLRSSTIAFADRSCRTNCSSVLLYSLVQFYLNASARSSSK